jgi:hypothetical protein
MNSVTSPLAIRKRKLVAFRGRGKIYSWLRVHAAEIAPRLERGEATWPAVCAEMVRHGICGRGGEAPTPNAAMRVWHRVVRDVEAEGAAPAKRRRLYPSRLPKDWRPPSAPAPANAPPTPPPASSDDYDSQKAMAALRRIMNERSGRKE